MVLITYDDEGFKDLFHFIGEGLSLPISIEDQEIVICISMTLYFILLHYLLKEYDREDHDFYIGDNQSRARVDTVVWDIGESQSLFDEMDDIVDHRASSIHKKSSWFGINRESSVN